MSQITQKAAIILQAMRKRLIVPAFNYITARTGTFSISPDLSKSEKDKIFTKTPEDSTNPMLADYFNEIHQDSVLTEIAVASLFELLSGNAKTIKNQLDTKGNIISTSVEYHRPDFTAIKFYLENVDPANWKDKTNTGTTDELIKACQESQERREAEKNAKN